jgi:hypothetical protein
VIADESELSELDLGGRPLMAWDPAAGALTDVTARRDAILAAWRARVRTAPLAARVAIEPAGTRLHLAPFATGVYSLIDDATVGRVLRFGPGLPCSEVAADGVNVFLPVTRSRTCRRRRPRRCAACGACGCATTRRRGWIAYREIAWE